MPADATALQSDWIFIKNQDILDTVSLRQIL